MPRLDMEARGVRDSIEQAGLGRGHPYLAAALQPAEQCLPPARVEVSSNFVEQEDRRCAASLGYQLGMG